MSAYLNNIEAVLDAGSLWVRMAHNRHWKVRRNGKTKTWKRSPGKFRIPLKMGLYGHTEVTEQDHVSFTGNKSARFLFSEIDPNR